MAERSRRQRNLLSVISGSGDQGVRRHVGDRKMLML